MLFAVVTAPCANLKIRRAFPDKVPHILGRVYDKLYIRTRFPGTVATAEKIDRALALWVAFPQFLALCRLVSCSVVFVCDREWEALFLPPL